MDDIFSRRLHQISNLSGPARPSQTKHFLVFSKLFGKVVACPRSRETRAEVVTFLVVEACKAVGLWAAGGWLRFAEGADCDRVRIAATSC